MSRTRDENNPLTEEAEPVAALTATGEIHHLRSFCVYGANTALLSPFFLGGSSAARAVISQGNIPLKLGIALLIFQKPPL